ncbi:MAG TPA: outer membrane protein assembly factor BamA [Nitrospirales bacterium]|nr:outer membrane protein assembly factor BamA [Nitrospirales bacterium]
MKYGLGALVILMACLELGHGGHLYAQDVDLLDGPVISFIDIRGNKRIESENILAKMGIKIGEVFSATLIQKEIRTIYGMGYFEDVQLETEPTADGLSLVVVVKENPFVTNIYYDGHENIKTDKLKGEVAVRTNTFLDQNQVEESVKALRTLYRGDGYYAATVIPVIQSTGEDKSTLTFYIKEGPLARVKHVDFVGNQKISSDDLREAVATQKYKFFTSWLSGSGTYKKDEMSNDIERIKDMYANKGFLNAKVGMPDVVLSDDKEWFHITFPVSEGEEYQVGELEFTGNEEFTDEELKATLEAKSGDVFQRKVMREEVERITDLYGSKGYVFADAKPLVVPDDDTHKADVTFSVTEGDLVSIRRINIAGNDKTRDKVIRREVRVNEGEVIETSAIKRSFQRLQNLNFFETVELVPEPLDDGEVDLNIRVKEKATGSFSIGGGFSSLDRLTAIFDIVEGNFMGKGQLLRLNAQLGERRTYANVSFREPYFLDTEISTQVDLFHQAFDVFTYQEARTGGGFSVTKPFGEYLYGGLNVAFERISITDLLTCSEAFNIECTEQEELEFLPPFITEQQGTQTTSSIGGNVSRDTRDYHLDPTTGSKQTASLELASHFFGGNNDFVKVLGTTVHYTSIWFDHVFSVRGVIGVSEPYGRDNDIPLTERLFVGSINGFPQVRGFGYGKAGPIVPGTDEVIGADKAMGFTFEYIVPIVKDAQINAAFFLDLGRGFEEGEAMDPLNLRQGAGLELRWISPFGPLRVAYGFKVDKRANETPGLLEFSIGSLF